MHPPIGRAQPRRVTHFSRVEKRGESLENFLPQVMERPNPPHARLWAQGGGAGKQLGSLQRKQQAIKKIATLGGTPGKILAAGFGEAYPPARTPTGTGGGGLGYLRDPPVEATGTYFFTSGK